MSKIFIAQPIGAGKVPKLELVGDEAVPDMDMNSPGLKEHREFYRAQGKIFVDDLFKSLPGGTIDAILIELLQRKACLLKVRYYGS